MFYNSLNYLFRDIEGIGGYSYEDFLLLMSMSVYAVLPILRFDWRHVLMTLSVFAIFLVYPWEIDFELQWLALATLLFINGQIMTFALTVIGTLPNLYGVRNLAVFDLKIETPNLVQLPANFFPGMWSLIFTVIIPFTSRFGTIFYLNIILTPVFLGLSMFTWKYSLNFYQSAN